MAPVGINRPAFSTPEDLNKVFRQVETFVRGVRAHNRWAEGAKPCLEFLEGKQYSDDEKRKREDQRRPSRVINRLRPLVFLVLGYFAQNKRQVVYKPGNDFNASDNVAEVLNRLSSVIDTENHLEQKVTTAFLDAISTGRGYIDQRLDFTRNIFGDVRVCTKDPFSIIIDPEADEYDPMTWSWVSEARWMSLDQIRTLYGRDAEEDAASVAYLHGGSGGPLGDSLISEDIVRPTRYFGQYDDDVLFNDDDIIAGMGYSNQSIREGTPYLIDRTRKLLRVVERQHKEWVNAYQFVDLITGRTRMIDESWSREKIAAVLQWSQERGRDAGTGQTLAVMRALVPRWRWTVTAGHMLLYDDWSPYRRPTITPVFAYFRRGITRGLLHDLLDPQREINKRRNNFDEILSKIAAGGWKIPEGTLTPEQEDHLAQFGSTPGVQVKYKVHSHGLSPEPLQPATPQRFHQMLEAQAADDLQHIAGISDAALGMTDKVESGRAVLAKQRSTVVGMEPFMDNLELSLALIGEARLEIIQDYYTEPRIFRARGDEGRDVTIAVNLRMADGTIINDVTQGTYAVTVDSQPLTATYEEAAFDSYMAMLERGIQIPQEEVIAVAPVPNRERVRQKLEQAQQMAMQQAQAGAAAQGQQGQGQQQRQARAA